MIKQGVFCVRTVFSPVTVWCSRFVQWSVLEMLQRLTSESPVEGSFLFFVPGILVSNCLLSVCVKDYWLIFILT